MALNAANTWEARAATGSDNNSGAWAPITLFSGVDLAVDASLNTKVTSAGHNFVAADVGTRIQISNTTTTTWMPGFYTINSVAANAATLSASPAPISSTGGVWAEVGADYSNQAAAQFSGTDLAIDAVTNTKVTSAGHNFTNPDVGNTINITAGTGYTTGIYQIISVAANAATLDRSPGAVGLTGGTWAEGGALATLGKLAGVMVANNKAFVTGAFTSTASITFTPGATGSPSGTTPPTTITGYGSTRGDSTHATLALATNTGLTAITLNSTGMQISQVDVDCASLGTSNGIVLAVANGVVRNCKVANFTVRGIYLNGSSSNQVYDCEVTGGTSAGTAAIEMVFGSNLAARCNVHDNTCPGIIAGANGFVEWCLVTNNSGASSDGVRASSMVIIFNNTIHNNGRDGIRQIGSLTLGAQQWRNNLLTSNTGFGMSQGGATGIPATPDNDGNAFFSNTSGARGQMDSTTGIFGVNPYVNVRDVILTASPYVGPTTGSTANFALNNTAAAGGACRAAGSPGAWLGNTGTTSFLDMGAVQTRGSSASPSPGTPGIIVATG